jgi:hypothetical protein
MNLIADYDRESIPRRLPNSLFKSGELQLTANNMNQNGRPGFAYKAALFLMLVIVAFYLIEEHRAHLIAYSGTIFFIIFIFLHVFMHMGHGGHGRHSGHVQKEVQLEPTEEEQSNQRPDEIGVPATQHEHRKEGN